MRKLLAEEIDRQLSGLPAWKREGDKLFRELTFPDFPRAFGFMSSVAIVCDTMDHHPEWFNVHTTVKIWLSSHEVNGISDRDFELARVINGLLGV